MLEVALSFEQDTRKSGWKEAMYNKKANGKRMCRRISGGAEVESAQKMGRWESIGLSCRTNAEQKITSRRALLHAKSRGELNREDVGESVEKAERLLL